MNANEVPAPPFWVVLFLTTVILLGFAALVLVGQDVMCDVQADVQRSYCEALR